MENELWVECIDNSWAFGELTIGKKYKVVKKLVKFFGISFYVLSNDISFYVLSNDKGEEAYYDIDRFKIVDKAPILSVIKWNGVNNINRFIEDKQIEIEIQVGQSHLTFILKVLIDKSFFASKQYVIQIDKQVNMVEDFMEEVNRITTQYNIKIELEQPKFKINCDKLYSKEEADRLRENGIDVSEVRV